MPDELRVRDLVAHLYIAADQVRPDTWTIDASDPASMAKALEYLLQHARATEGALRKVGQLMDEMRSAPPVKGRGKAPAEKDEFAGDASPEARQPGAAS